MSSLRLSIAVSALLALSGTTSANAQDALPASARSCVSDWGCGAVRPPLGFYVDSVTDDGRYITLEDGTTWEVQIDFRATTGAWQPNDFVEVRRIAAPTGDYEWLFTKADGREWRAAVRFAGRVRR
jgi:hypothetical protein